MKSILVYIPSQGLRFSRFIRLFYERLYFDPYVEGINKVDDIHKINVPFSNVVLAVKRNRKLAKLSCWSAIDQKAVQKHSMNFLFIVNYRNWYHY